ncbi:hypothetical protein TNCV_1432991 [Trichonephila clavipes]|nr:hypothetical protein TNCV_1432991 [Trichonephila clavipes]
MKRPIPPSFRNKLALGLCVSFDRFNVFSVLEESTGLRTPHQKWSTAWSPKRSPKMMPTCFYHQDFAVPIESPL